MRGRYFKNKHVKSYLNIIGSATVVTSAGGRRNGFHMWCRIRKSEEYGSEESLEMFISSQLTAL